MERDKDRDRAAEMEKMRLDMEHELKLKQLETSRVGSDNGEEVIEGEAGEGPLRVRVPKWEETLAGRTKLSRDTLRHVLPKMPTDVGHQIPQYFENVEHLFDIYMRCLLTSAPNY